MSEFASQRRRQFCRRCGQLMFEFFSSPDGHFGIVDELERSKRSERRELICPACGARYRLLDRVSEMGQPIERK